jgi:hypothetical protein
MANEYGLFIQGRSLPDDLSQEFSQWEEASEEDALAFSKHLEGSR